MQAYYLPPLRSMSVWQTETKGISRQEKFSGQGCSRQLEEGQALSRTMHCCGSLHLLHQGKTFHFKQQNEGHWHVYWRSTLCGHELQMSGKCVSTNLNTHQTLKANQDFELKCKDAGVIPLKYISDNGTAFTSKSYTLPISPISPKFNDLLELVHITTMKVQRRPFKPSYLLQEHGCSTQRYIGQKSLTPPFGQWQSSMLPISTTRFLIHPQASAQMISSPRQDGRKGSSMIFVFGDVHSMFWTRQILMARNFHVGNQELFEES